MTEISAFRSALMGRVRGKNTKPELIVRRAAFQLGYRYRLHSRKLPGSPDLVFRKRRKVVFVHGCFWHRHEGCKKATSPKTRIEFWQGKFDANISRDLCNLRDLEADGWQVHVIWECETSDITGLKEKLGGFLGKV